MAISPIGNITYINQNMQTTSAQHANATQRGDFIPQEFEEKLKEIEEVRPTQENEGINKDAQNKQHNPYKQQSKQNKPNKTQPESTKEDDSNDSEHLLNIKV